MSPSVPCADDFFRQDLISVIHRGNTIVGMTLHHIFDLQYESNREHSYFSSNYSKPFLEKLVDMGVNRAMSIEYLTVNPLWRKNNIDGFSLVDCLGSLATNFMGTFPIDAMIAPARADVGVSKVAKELGYISLQEGEVRHNVLCDLICLLRENIKLSQDVRVREAVSNLWKQRNKFLFEVEGSDQHPMFVPTSVV